MYTFDGSTYESVEKFSTPGSPGGLGVNGTGTFNMVMPALDNKAFNLIWRWYNDALVQGPYSFSIDNVLVTGDAAPVESDVANNDSETVKTGNQVYFISDQDGGVIGVIENASADLGCVTMEVVSDGVSDNFSNISGSHSGKVYQITSSTSPAATYDVTLYFTDAEVSDFSNPDALSIIKVSDTSIDAASDSPGNYVIATPIIVQNVDQGYRSYKATFTGFSVFALYNPETLSQKDNKLSDFEIYPTLLTNEDNITINSRKKIENVSVYNINGKLLSSVKVNKLNTNVNVDKLSAGLYFLVINKMNTYKFIIK